jgi:hypothetical protein
MPRELKAGSEPKALAVALTGTGLGFTCVGLKTGPMPSGAMVGRGRRDCGCTARDATTDTKALPIIDRPAARLVRIAPGVACCPDQRYSG